MHEALVAPVGRLNFAGEVLDMMLWFQKFIRIQPVIVESI